MTEHDLATWIDFLWDATWRRWMIPDLVIRGDAVCTQLLPTARFTQRECDMVQTILSQRAGRTISCSLSPEDIRDKAGVQSTCIVHDMAIWSHRNYRIVGELS